MSDIDQIIAEIRASRGCLDTREGRAELLLALADAYETILSSEKQARCLLVKETQLLANLTAERDQLLAERDSGLWIHGRRSPLRVELDDLRSEYGKLLARQADERAEIARQADVIVEHERRKVSLVAEIDHLDAIRRQQEQDNLDLIAKLAKAEDALAMNRERDKELR